MAGSDDARALWGQHLGDQDFSTVIYVVDSTRQSDLAMAADELTQLLGSKSLAAEVPVLILAVSHTHAAQRCLWR
mgnify:CR=1 FL=1